MEGAPKFGEARALTPEERKQGEFKDHLFHFHDRWRFFEKRGEEFFGKGHGEVVPVREELAQAKQKGEAYYLALLQYLAEQRRFTETTTWKERQSDAAELFGEFKLSCENEWFLRHFSDKDKLEINLSDRAAWPRIAEQLVNALRYGNTLVPQEKIQKKIADFLAEDLKRRLRDKEHHEVEEVFILEFLRRYFIETELSSFDMHEISEKIRQEVRETGNIDAGFRCQGLINAMRNLQATVYDKSWYMADGKTKQDLAEQFAEAAKQYSYVFRRTDYWQYFFDYTAKHLIREDRHGVYDADIERPAGEYRLLVLGKISDAKDYAEKEKIVLQSVDAFGADFALTHFFEWQLTGQEEEALLFKLAEADAAAVIRNAKYIPFVEFENAPQILNMLAVKQPLVFSARLNELGLTGAEAEKFFTDMIKQRPLEALLAFDSFLENARLAGRRAELAAQLIERFTDKNLPYTPADYLNDLTGHKVNSAPELNELISRLREESIGFFAGQYKLDDQKDKYYSVRDRVKQAQDALKPFGLKKAFRDIALYAFALTVPDQEKPPDDEEESAWDYSDFQVICRVSPDAAESEPLPTSDACRLALRHFIQKRHSRALSTIGEMQLDFSRADDVRLMRQGFDIYCQSPYADKTEMDYFRWKFYESPVFTPEEKKKWLADRVKTDWALLFEVTGSEKFAAVADEDQKFELLNKIINEAPDFLGYWKEVGLRNGKKALALMQKVFDKKITPYCWCASPGRALTLFESDYAGWLWRAENKDEFLEKSRSIEWARSNMAPGLYVLFNKKEGALARLDEFSVESLRAMDALYRRRPDFFPVDLGGWAEKAFGFDVFHAVNMGNLDRFVELAKQAEAAETAVKKGNRLWQGRKTWRGKIVEKKKPDQTLDSRERDEVIRLILESGRNIDYDSFRREFIKTAECFSSVYGFLREIYPSSFDERPQGGYPLYRFFQEHSIDFKRFEERWPEDENGNKRGLMETMNKLARLEQAQIKVFFRRQGYDELARGFAPHAVEALLISFAAAGVLRLDKENDRPLFRRYMEMFGLFNSPRIFTMTKTLLRGEPVDAALQAIGVSQTGEVGLAELAKVCKQVRNESIMRPVLEKRILHENSPVVLEILRHCLDFDTSSWSHLASSDFETLVSGVINGREKGEFAPLAPEYTVGLMRGEKLKQNLVITEAAQIRYKQIFEGADLALNNGEKSLLRFKENLFYRIGREGDRIKEQIRTVELDDTMAQEERDKRLAGLGEQDAAVGELYDEVEARETTADLLALLLDFEIKYGKNKENRITSTTARALVYRIAAETRPEHGEALRDLAEAPITKNNLEKAAEFVGNTIKEHTVPELNLNPEQKKKLLKILNTRAIMEEVARLNSATSGNFAEFACVPSRDLLLETSGYYMDACWTRRDSIAKQYPGLLAVAFISNPESEERRLAGGTLLYETTIGGGREKVIVIRGFNPKQSVITDLNPVSLVDGFVENYLTPICRARGISKILIPRESQTNQSQTNRPSIFAALKDRLARCESVKLDGVFNFNGYNIADRCVVLKTVQSPK